MLAFAYNSNQKQNHVVYKYNKIVFLIRNSIGLRRNEAISFIFILSEESFITIDLLWKTIIDYSKWEILKMYKLKKSEELWEKAENCAKIPRAVGFIWRAERKSDQQFVESRSVYITWNHVANATKLNRRSYVENADIRKLGHFCFQLSIGHFCSQLIE